MTQPLSAEEIEELVTEVALTRELHVTREQGQALLAMASRLVELEPENSAMLHLLHFNGMPDCQAYTLGTDAWFAQVGDEGLRSAETPEELAKQLGWPGPTSQAKGG